ncbi:bifunctional 3,4-dihydroxy-2-butanone-4-phosphate synthase/GTP cyclohydrolase II [Vallitalea okinawensis]|uniref:bifunctional 3,4-dihydroxy-2-butanone-4-phosphate synthase/GTP cyclohydrolase II n=1 Tax=Vallitalea okinawensis TaxID=2078660 RepID=UPI000CFDB9C2|nr:bifunctional 3,4-dihydroxy-2-butanone-4-phosphate synthase/GTP cyclohydrolase II [Vallitalea okinawensis]
MFATIEEAIQDIKDGKMIIVVDDEDRENEGDLVMAAEKVTPEHINFMVSHGRGLVCVPITEKRSHELQLSRMVDQNSDPRGTAFTVSVDAKECATGISAYERALTINKLVAQSSKDIDFSKPGHIFPLVAKSGGVLQREGHTEAAVDLARLAGCEEAGVICEILKEDGHMARLTELREFAKVHKLKMITIEALIEYRKKSESTYQLISEASLPTKYGEFIIKGYEHPVTKAHHIALIKGDLTDTAPVLTRIHSECLTGDVLGSSRCDCGSQLEAALKIIAEEGRGVLLYLRQEGRGIGLVNKIKAYALQDEGLDTVEANLHLGFDEDLRDYQVAVDMYKDLGISKIKLMTNNPEKIKGLEDGGIEVTERVPIEVGIGEHNHFYLETKKEKMQHMLEKI